MVQRLSAWTPDLSGAELGLSPREVVTRSPPFPKEIRCKRIHGTVEPRAPLLCVDVRIRRGSLPSGAKDQKQLDDGRRSFNGTQSAPEDFTLRMRDRGSHLGRAVTAAVLSRCPNPCGNESLPRHRSPPWSETESVSNRRPGVGTPCS